MSKSNISEDWMNDKSNNLGFFQIPNTSVEITTSNNVEFNEAENETVMVEQISQQKLASLMPRGTRVDSTGNRIQLRGARNYTSQTIYVGRDEVFDDVVVRGLRAEGLSTKFGVKNRKEGIAKLLRELFNQDSRWTILEEHFKSQRQKSNCAKTIFSTMTHEELQLIKSETFPSRIDVQVRDFLIKSFSNCLDKLQATLEVLDKLQQVFKLLTPQTDFLSTHNFHTRGFFLDITLMTCSFLTQIIQDSERCSQKLQNEQMKTQQKQQEDMEKAFASTLVQQQQHQQNKVNEKEVEVKTAAEILLSVGNDVQNEEHQTIPFQIVAKDNTIVEDANNQEEVVNRSDGSQTLDLNCDDNQWTTVEMIDAEGNTKYMLIKADNETNILQILQSQGFQEESLAANNIIQNIAIISEEDANKEEENCRQYTTSEPQALPPEVMDINVNKSQKQHIHDKNLNETMAEIKQLIHSDKDPQVQCIQNTTGVSLTNTSDFSDENMQDITLDAGLVFKHPLTSDHEEDVNKRFKHS